VGASALGGYAHSGYQAPLGNQSKKLVRRGVLHTPFLLLSFRQVAAKARPADILLLIIYDILAAASVHASPRTEATLIVLIEQAFCFPKINVKLVCILPY